MADRSNPAEPAALLLPMPQVVGFIRQLSHDLRNHLNAAELQSAYLNEISEDAETKEEVKRLRGMLGEMGQSLERLTNSLAAVRLTEMPYEAASFVEDLQQKVKQLHPNESAEIGWESQVGKAMLMIDPQILQQALLELFANAFRHSRGSGKLTAHAAIERNEFVFELREPKANFALPLEEWGREPLRTVGHGHYGLGLHRVRIIIEAHRGQFHVRHDSASSSLVTRITLPLAERGD